MTFIRHERNDFVGDNFLEYKLPIKILMRYLVKKKQTQYSPIKEILLLEVSPSKNYFKAKFLNSKEEADWYQLEDWIFLEELGE